MLLPNNLRIAHQFYSTIAKTSNLKICIIGSGPAGFYTASKVLRNHKEAEIDIYEKLPVPFGLVRYGVAPDHPQVKRCIHNFTQAAKKDRVSFFGNVAVGKDVTFPQLQDAYHGIVLAYGAGKDKMLNVPGEQLSNVLSAKSFVGWYNGLPHDSQLKLSLDVEDVVVIGHGNVALDVARILLTPVDILKNTDIPEPVLEILSKSRVKNVTLVGRRGPEHAAFSGSEFREMMLLQNTRLNFLKKEFEHVAGLMPFSQLDDHKMKILGFMSDAVLESRNESKQGENGDKTWNLRYQLSPKEIMSNGSGVESVKFVKNRIQDGKAFATDEEESIPCQMVVRSIGYTSIQIDPAIPFDHSRGIVPNSYTRVDGLKGVYVCGWLGTGPVGVIATTMYESQLTGKIIKEDVASGVIGATPKAGKRSIMPLFEAKGVKPVSFDDWRQLDQHEVTLGKKLGKPREKITDIKKMLDIAHDSS